jgi:glucokinase
MRMASEAVSRGEAPEMAKAMKRDPEFSAKAIYQMAALQDAVALQIFSNVGQALGIALANMINVLNLPMYVIGGGVASAWDLFAPAMLDQVQRRSFVYNATAAPAGILRIEKPTANSPHSRQTTIIARASLGSDAGLLGAARLPMIATAGEGSTAERILSSAAARGED